MEQNDHLINHTFLDHCVTEHTLTYSDSMGEFRGWQPDSFHQGHIVEIRCLFIAIPFGRGKYKSVTELDCLSFLEEGCAKVRCIARSNKYKIVQMQNR